MHYGTVTHSHEHTESSLHSKHRLGQKVMCTYCNQFL
uniref:Uncharacterized protein n=1 Tax=Anguilla anguilla TaxID=7936 RepID=A0A0E9RZT0_ANGAN